MTGIMGFDHLMITSPVRMYPSLLRRYKSMSFLSIMQKVKAKGGSSSYTVTGDNAALLQRCMEFKGYVPTLYQSLSKSEISDMLQQGVTTQFELHSFLQDPSHGILANIVEDAKRAYDLKAFDKKTQVSHMKGYLDQDPYGSMAIDPRDEAMWSKAFSTKVLEYQQAVQSHRRGTPPNPADFFDTGDTSHWSRKQNHLRVVQDQCYFRTISFFQKMQSRSTLHKITKLLEEWYEHHACQGQARCMRETRMPVAVMVKYMHRMCVPTTPAELLKSLSDLERTENHHNTVEKWAKAVNEKRVIALTFCGDGSPMKPIIDSQATKTFVSHLDKHERMRLQGELLKEESLVKGSEILTDPDASPVHNLVGPTKLLPDFKSMGAQQKLLTRYKKTLYAAKPRVNNHEYDLHQRGFEVILELARRERLETQARLDLRSTRAFLRKAKQQLAVNTDRKIANLQSRLRHATALLNTRATTIRSLRAQLKKAHVTPVHGNTPSSQAPPVVDKNREIRAADALGWCTDCLAAGLGKFHQGPCDPARRATAIAKAKAQHRLYEPYTINAKGHLLSQQPKVKSNGSTKEKSKRDRPASDPAKKWECPACKADPTAYTDKGTHPKSAKCLTTALNSAGMTDNSKRKGARKAFMKALKQSGNRKLAWEAFVTYCESNGGTFTASSRVYSVRRVKRSRHTRTRAPAAQTQAAVSAAPGIAAVERNLDITPVSRNDISATQLSLPVRRALSSAPAAAEANIVEENLLDGAIQDTEGSFLDDKDILSQDEKDILSQDERGAGHVPDDQNPIPDPSDDSTAEL